MHSKIQLALALGLTTLSFNTPMFASEIPTITDVEFPLREKYNECEPVSTQQLAQWVDSAIIVDVRNTVEFDVIHINGAVNLLVGKMTEAELLKLREKNGDTPIVFYCNGVTCSKSYKATQMAVAWGFENVFVYDAGVFDFYKNFPQHGQFFGEQLDATQAQTALISKEELQAISIPPADFIQKATTGGYTVFDVRDNKERSEYPINLPGIKKVSMDQLVKFLDKPGAIPSGQFVVLDNVGKQVKWLHYYLKRTERSDFFFLAGGVKAWKEAGFDADGNPGAVAGVNTED